MASAGVWIAGCQDSDAGPGPDPGSGPGPAPNRPPAAVGTIPAPGGHAPIPDLEVGAGGETTVDASSHFTDPDGDPLAYRVRASNATVAAASVSGNTVTVRALRRGRSTITVTARDAPGLAAALSFVVTVPDGAPAGPRPIPDIELFLNRRTTVTASAYFQDPDGDGLTYAAVSSNPAVATATASGDLVRLEALTRGATTIAVTARDYAGLEASLSFQVTVPNRPPSITATLPDVSVEEGEERMVVLSRFFSDPDGDALTFSATSSDETRAHVDSSADTIWIKGASVGTARITVSATDAPGLSAAGVHLGVDPREHRTERRDLQPPGELRRRDHGGGRRHRGRTADPVHRRHHRWPERNPGLRGPVQRPLE